MFFFSLPNWVAFISFPFVLRLSLYFRGLNKKKTSKQKKQTGMNR